MIDQQYYDEQSDRYFDNLLALAEYYDDYSDRYENKVLPSNIYKCELDAIGFRDAKEIANGLLRDFYIECKGDYWENIYHDWTTASRLANSAAEDFYWNCNIDDIPVIKGENDLQRSLDTFTAINKPFWKLGGDSMIGLCIIDRALRKIERENAKVHCLWYPTKQRIELTDRVWQSLKLKNWQLIDGEWRAIA